MELKIEVEPGSKKFFNKKFTGEEFYFFNNVIGILRNTKRIKIHIVFGSFKQKMEHEKIQHNEDVSVDAKSYFANNRDNDLSTVETVMQFLKELIECIPISTNRKKALLKSIDQFISNGYCHERILQPKSVPKSVGHFLMKITHKSIEYFYYNAVSSKKLFLFNTYTEDLLLYYLFVEISYNGQTIIVRTIDPKLWIEITPSNDMININNTNGKFNLLKAFGANSTKEDRQKSIDSLGAVLYNPYNPQ